MITSTDDIHELLERWQHEGLLDATEVTRIEAAEAARRTTPRPTAHRTASFIGEALGYVGGALILAALGVLIGRSWADLVFGTQLALTGGGAVVLLVAGFFVSDRMGAPGRRLRAVLWAVSTGLAFGTWMLISGKEGFDWDARAMVFFSAALGTAQAALLWWQSRHVVMHLVTFATLAALVGSLSAYVTGEHAAVTGLSVALFGAVWVLLAAVDVVRPPLPAFIAGSIVAVMAAQATTDRTWGAVFVLVMAAAVIAFAVWRRSLPVLAVGTYGVLTGVPAAADRLFPGSLGVALGLLVAGVVLVASALWITRHPGKESVIRG